MAFTAAALNAAADAIAGQASHISLHSADPGATGTNELAGGSYARQASGWNAAGAVNPGEAFLTADETFEVPGGSTVSHVGLWTALSGGTFLGGFALPSSEVYGADGQYIVDSATTKIDVNAV